MQLQKPGQEDFQRSFWDNSCQNWFQINEINSSNLYPFIIKTIDSVNFAKTPFNSRISSVANENLYYLLFM